MTIAPESLIVLASNAGMFRKRYGFAPDGEYMRQLDNGGDRLTLVGITGDTLFTVHYRDKAPWPESADGGGYSLVAVNLNGYGNPDSAVYWRASLYINGSPRRDDTVISIDDTPEPLPDSFELMQNYPNPFNSSTTIEYLLPKQCHVTLRVYDILGREVATLVNQIETPGYKYVNFDAGRFASGIYYYRLETGSYTGTKKMVLLK
jgi:hypothetical protein